MMCAACRQLVLYWTRLACMGDDDGFVSRYEGDKLVSAQVNYPADSTRQHVQKVEDSNEDAVMHEILPEDRDNEGMLSKQMQKSRLLRLVILSHQLDESKRQQSKVREVTQDKTTQETAEKSTHDQVIPEDEIMRCYKESDPVLMKSCYKYWDGATSMWTSHRLGACLMCMCVDCYSTA